MALVTFKLPAGGHAISRVRSPALGIWLAGVGIWAVGSAAVPPPLIEYFFWFCALTAGAGSLLARFPVQADLGDDGMLLRWFWRRRFVPYRRMRSVQSTTDTSAALPFLGHVIAGRVDVLLDDGETLRLTTHNKFGGSQRVTEGLAARLEAGRRATGEASSTPSLIGRNPGEGSTAFLARARALLSEGRGAEAFRSAAIPVDALEARLIDPLTDPDERVAAAIALRAQQGGLRPELVRIVADTTAHPAIRIAVNADGNSGDEVGVARALDRVDERKR